jgi:hypothetical protein
MKQPQKSFADAAIKVAWATHLLGELEKSIVNYLGTKPYTIALSPEPSGILLVVTPTVPLPENVPCLAGDICSNLRAALDFCWTGLQRMEGVKDPKDGLPFTDNEKGLRTTATNAFKDKTLKKVIDLLATKIRSHRDFGSGGNQNLCLLNDLRNWQKHNMLITSFGVTRLPSDAVLSSDDGSVIVLGGARVSGRVAFIGGQKADLRYSGDPVVEVLTEFRSLTASTPLIPLMSDLLDETSKAVAAFNAERWN